MSLTITQVDAFTSEPFGGNPAAVCLLPAPADAAWMQRVAREMNLSETAFLVRREDRGFDLRWFTPAVEVDLCGHATLASAHVLWEEGHLPPDAPAVFHTRSGRLSAELRGEWIEMDFPAEPARPCSCSGRTCRRPWHRAGIRRPEPLRLPRRGRHTGRPLSVFAPDFSRLAGIDTRGIIVTARAESDGLDFVSRFFAPRTGIDEDPVTGSAHCCLGPYWQSLPRPGHVHRTAGIGARRPRQSRRSEVQARHPVGSSRHGSAWRATHLNRDSSAERRVSGRRQTAVPQGSLLGQAADSRLNRAQQRGRDTRRTR